MPVRDDWMNFNACASSLCICFEKVNLKALSTRQVGSNLSQHTFKLSWSPQPLPSSKSQLKKWMDVLWLSSTSSPSGLDFSGSGRLWLKLAHQIILTFSDKNHARKSSLCLCSGSLPGVMQVKFSKETTPPPPISSHKLCCLNGFSRKGLSPCCSRYCPRAALTVARQEAHTEWRDGKRHPRPSPRHKGDSFVPERQRAGN